MRRQEIVALSGTRSVWSIDRRAGLEHGTSMSEIADEYAAQLRAIFSEPVDVIGVSTGGGIALQLALDHPDTVRRLVLVSAASRLSDSGRDLQRDIATALRDGRPRRAAAMFLSNTGATRATRALLVIAGYLAPRIVVGHHDSDLLVTLDAEDAFDLSSRLPDVRIPTLVVGGANDRFYTAELFAATAAGIPEATLAIHRGAGHMGMQGNRRLAGAVLDFLARIPESTAD
jgi:pimeloyl-ACP methyl ester carboxylesterase